MATATATAKQTNSINGVDLDVLTETVAAIQKDPELGMARARFVPDDQHGRQRRSERHRY